MQTKERRPLSLFDLLILVAATGIGFGLIRAFAYVEGLRSPPVGPFERETILVSACLILMTLSLGTLAASLAPPRPRLRRLSRRPGFLAGVAVAANALFQCLSRGVPWLARGAGMPGAWWTRAHNLLASLCLPSFVAQAILLAWAVGLLHGFSRRRDWIERLGRALGLAWIAAWIAVVAGLLGV